MPPSSFNLPAFVQAAGPSRSQSRTGARNLDRPIPYQLGPEAMPVPFALTALGELAATDDDARRAGAL